MIYHGTIRKKSSTNQIQSYNHDSLIRRLYWFHDTLTSQGFFTESSSVLSYQPKSAPVTGARICWGHWVPSNTKPAFSSTVRFTKNNVASEKVKWWKWESSGHTEGDFSPLFRGLVSTLVESKGSSPPKKGTCETTNLQGLNHSYNML